ncbi:MAG: M48 family metalloprotease [Gammaproteobacteria bacterium]|nr:M48 family metalloprotease [Gammaproteobacteria bacterium]
MVEEKLPLVSDAIVNDYIQSLGYRLAANSDAPTHAFHFFVVQQNVINAFAGPGGYIGIFGGLINITETESELASVIAHEIAHVTQDHLQRGEDKTKNLTLPALAAMVAAIATGNGTIAASSISSIAAGGAQYQINTTRGFEEEADSIGIQTLARAGFNPYAMANFFKRMMQSSRYDSTPIPILMDHPVNAERIALAEQRAAGFSKKHTYPSSQQYSLAKARMQYLLAINPENFLAQAKAAYQRNPNNMYQQYLLALAMFKNQEYTESKQLLAQLANNNPHEMIYPYTLAQIAFVLKEYKSALYYIQQAYAQDRNYYPSILFYGLILLRNNEKSAAINLLEQYQLQYADSPDFWILLSKCLCEQS